MISFFLSTFCSYNYTRGPRYLPLEPDSEAEKVNLRHQDMEERKGTEEWMLDYALRQVVSKLTPARKRKVELLVEAFVSKLYFDVIYVHQMLRYLTNVLLY